MLALFYAFQDTAVSHKKFLKWYYLHFHILEHTNLKTGGLNTKWNLEKHYLQSLHLQHHKPCYKKSALKVVQVQHFYEPLKGILFKTNNLDSETTVGLEYEV